MPRVDARYGLLTQTADQAEPGISDSSAGRLALDEADTDEADKHATCTGR